MNILFIGTAEFGIPALDALLGSSEHKVVGVVTQPDKPVGRKQIIAPTPVKEFLLQKKFQGKIFQPEKIKIDATDILRQTSPEIIVVVAYGQMIPKEMLEAPKFGAINIHGSLLPKYRGAVPIEAALLNGEKETGVSILQMTEGLDDGPVLVEEKLKINDQDDAVTLRQKLGEIGKILLINTLEKISSGSVEKMEQQELMKETKREISYCKVSDMAREKAEITDQDSATTAWNKVRAFANSSNAWLKIYRNGKIQELKIKKAKLIDNNSGKLTLEFARGAIELIELQLAGKKPGKANDYQFLSGLQIYKP